MSENERDPHDDPRPTPDDDGIGRLRAALRDAPAPKPAARAAALAAARAAFDAEWQGSVNQDAAPTQGMRPAPRRRGERPDGPAARPGRRRMSTANTTAATSAKATITARPFWLATASAAAITVAAFVAMDAGLLPQPGDRNGGAEVEAPENVASPRADRAVTTAAREAAAPDASTASSPRIAAEPALPGAPMPSVASDMPVSTRPMPQASREAAPPIGRKALPDAFATGDAVAPFPHLAGNERHPDAAPSGTLLVADAPVSTFSADVDTASYAFVRDTLLDGRLPHPDAVRPEEMVNYFDYALPAPAPDGDAPFSVSTGVIDTPWNEATRLLAIGIRGIVPPPGERGPRNLVFLIDTSGSMGEPDKLPLLKRSFRLLLTRLDPADEVAIVTYAGSAATVLEPTPASDARAILDALDALVPGGSTAGSDGLSRAYAVADRMTGEGEGARILLATDGDFNVGPASPDELERFVAANRRTASLSVLGFGRGNTNDRLMQAIAQNGDGFAAHIDTEAEARRVMGTRVGSTLDTIARDVKVQVEFNPAAVSAYRLIGYETRALTRPDFNDDKVDAGEIGAGHRTIALYEVTPANASPVDPLRYGTRSVAADGTDAADELAFLRLRYKAPVASDDDASALIELPVAPDADAFPPGEVRFAAAVAAFADTLRGVAALSGFTLDDVEALAAASLGTDATGDRREFLSLVGLAKQAR